jgi:hypothetical protein
VRCSSKLLCPVVEEKRARSRMFATLEEQWVRRSSSVERGHEDNVVVWLQLIVCFAF